MTYPSWRNWRYPAEFALLLGLAFFLPLREAPKNLLWLAYVVVWVVNRARAHDAGGAPDLWEGLIALLVAGGLAAAAFGGIHRGDGNEWWAVGDIVRYGLLFVLVRRASYEDGQKLLLLSVLVASCVIAELEAVWNWKVVGKRKALELFSVGHVNHSAIYLAICLGVAAGLLAALWPRLRISHRAWLGAATLAMATGLFLGGSRAAGAVAVLLLALAALIGAKVSGSGRRAFAALGVVLAFAAIVGGTSALDRQIEWGAQNYSLAQRDLIWNRGLTAWRESPVFGVGMENYGHFDEAQLKTWLAHQGRPYVAAEHVGAPHAHSLYVNTLVERGAAGLATVLLLLAAWAVTLARSRPAFAAPGAVLALWCASASAWLVTVVIGFANTTLHHEHAMLALLLLGLALPWRAGAATTAA
jgi:O-antigen ligase